jgi:hypothetical protein
MAAHPVRMSNMQGRAQERIERLHLGESEGIIERRQARMRKALRDEDQHRRRLSENAAIGDHGRDATFRIDREIIGRALLILRETDACERVIRAGLLERDMRGERTGVGGVIQFEHRRLPSPCAG